MEKVPDRSSRERLVDVSLMATFGKDQSADGFCELLELGRQVGRDDGWKFGPGVSRVRKEGWRR